MRVSYEQLYNEMRRVLLKKGFTEERASLSAKLFTDASRDGVYSHGFNRFPSYIEYIDKGFIDVHAVPEKIESLGAIERWEGNRGPGNLNAYTSMERAIELAHEYGMGCVALRNTNHWMRAGNFGWQAAEAGCISMAWTNTLPNLPPWGSAEQKIGNNPMMLGVPREDGHIILDVAMSQFSYGSLNTYASRGDQLPVAGGYDQEGNVSTDPVAITESGRLLPIGYWKGSGLSILLDIIATMLSGGKSTYEVGLEEGEQMISQVFIAFDLKAMGEQDLLKRKLELIITDLQQTTPLEAGHDVRYPGQGTLSRRADHLEHGIPVDPERWQQLLDM